MSESVLIIDDELALLQGIRRRLQKQFDLSTAEGGKEAIDLVQNGKKKFAVVVSDMKMPEISGVETLSAIREISPDTVAIMLTGIADQTTAAEAINEGKIFRFLSKPCSMDVLAEEIEEALKQYRLVTTERELFNETLSGSVKVVVDMLSLVDPASFSHSSTLKAWAGKVAVEINFTPVWELGLAAMLSPIGNVAVPPSLRQKVMSGADLTDEERQILSAASETAYRLLANIPRLRGVSEFIRYQEKYFDGRGFPNDDVKGSVIPEGARVLSILISLDRETNGALPTSETFNALLDDAGRYDVALLSKIEKCFLRPIEASEIEVKNISANDIIPKKREAINIAAKNMPKKRERIFISLNKLSPGHILFSDLKTIEGHLILASGMQLTESQIELLKKQGSLNKIKEPIEVTALLPEPKQV